MVAQNYETKIFETNKKDIENSKDRRTRTRRGCAGTTNPVVTRKPDNIIQGIWNPVPRKSDNALKGVQNLVRDRTWNQWPRGLTIQT